MALEVTGKITKILDLQTGTTQSGSEWKKQSFILETTETYNNVYCFETVSYTHLTLPTNREV